MHCKSRNFLSVCIPFYVNKSKPQGNIVMQGTLCLCAFLRTEIGMHKDGTLQYDNKSIFLNLFSLLSVQLACMHAVTLTCMQFYWLACSLRLLSLHAVAWFDNLLVIPWNYKKLSNFLSEQLTRTLQCLFSSFWGVSLTLFFSAFPNKIIKFLC